MLSGCKNENDCDVMWNQQAPNLLLLKQVIRENLVVGVIDGLPSIMEGVLKDLYDWEFWVRYLNESVKAAMNEDGTYMTVMHPNIRPHFPALEPIFKCTCCCSKILVTTKGEGRLNWRARSKLLLYSTWYHNTTWIWCRKKEGHWSSLCCISWHTQWW